jgi:hypothetical protein
MFYYANKIIQFRHKLKADMIVVVKMIIKLYSLNKLKVDMIVVKFQALETKYLSYFGSNFYNPIPWQIVPPFIYIRRITGSN